MPKKKLNIGWFSFTCCEDSTIMLTEMLNDHYEEWFKLLNFKEIRKNCKKLVAIGSCAVTGMPSAQRNNFDKKTKEEISFLLARFGHTEKAYNLKELVKVDYEVPGCPMDEKIFLSVLQQCLKEFNVA